MSKIIKSNHQPITTMAPNAEVLFLLIAFFIKTIQVSLLANQGRVLMQAAQNQTASQK